MVTSKWRIGVDVGGTFTDVAIVNEEDGTMGVAKVSSTPEDFGVGVLKAIEQALKKYKIIKLYMFIKLYKIIYIYIYEIIEL